MVAIKEIQVQNCNRFVLSNKKSIIHKEKNRNWNIEIFYLIFKDIKKWRMIIMPILVLPQHQCEKKKKKICSSNNWFFYLLDNLERRMIL